MSARATTYRSKASEVWKATFDTLSTIRLYLMSRNGPTVFQLRDESDNSFKVTLGNPHLCSCQGGRPPSKDPDVCVHIMFCMVKVLKVAKAHPLCFQSSLLDSELDQILSGQCSYHAHSRRSLITSEEGGIISPAKATTNTASAVKTVVRQELSADEDESCCPICQDAMTLKPDAQFLTWCRHGCGNNIHANCMMKFAQVGNRGD